MKQGRSGESPVISYHTFSRRFKTIRRINFCKSNSHDYQQATLNRQNIRHIASQESIGLHRFPYTSQPHYAEVAARIVCSLPSSQVRFIHLPRFLLVTFAAVCYISRPTS